MHLHTKMRSENRVSFDIAEAFKEISEKLDEIQKEIGDKAERHELESLRNTLEDVRRNGSGHAQDALRELNEMRAKVIALDMGQASKDSVERALATLVEQQRNMKYFWVGLIANILLGMMGTFVAIASIVLHFFSSHA